jgi:four helix bundle protein
VLRKIDRFEDLIAWRKARDLTRAIYQVTRREEFARDFGLARQVQRAAGSIMSKLAEGCEGGSRGEFYQFLSTAKASCVEICSHIDVALDVGYLDRTTLTNLPDKAAEVARIVGSLRSAVAMQRDEHR